MASDKTVLFLGPDRAGHDSLVDRFAAASELVVMRVDEAANIVSLLNRTVPVCVILESTGDGAAKVEVVREIKADAFTSIVPLLVIVPEGAPDLVVELLSAGADEVIHRGLSEAEQILRLERVVKRTDRDVSINPTSRLPGTNLIAHDMELRSQRGEKFAVCYADLDHFKEFNDRYGYASGDGVIKLLSRILRDLVRGLAPGGFVGHIGGDDFILNVPMEHVEETCDEIIRLFDELIPYQYTEEDRRAGYFLGKDRRGNIHRIPLMALSIGVVSNLFQDFEHTAQISELAAEMKSYAKSLPGSKYVVDRRHKPPTLETASAEEAESLVGSVHRSRRPRPPERL